MAEEISKEDILKLLEKYPLDKIIPLDIKPWWCQYDAISHRINYAMTRQEKPSVVVEFGTRGGGCTFTIFKALLANKREFVYMPYELEDDNRQLSQHNLNEAFGKNAPIVGGDIMKTKNLPDNIDYLFVDNYHDYETTKWVFEYLLPKKCKKGALVHFHDLVIHGNFEFDMPNYDNIPPDGEQLYLHELNKSGKLPLEKIFWGWEHNVGSSATWWRYK